MLPSLGRPSRCVRRLQPRRPDLVFPAGPRLPGDRRLRPGLKSNFSSSGSGGGGGGGNRPLPGPPQTFSRPGGRTAAGAAGRGGRARAWRQRGVLSSLPRGGRGRGKSGGEVGNPPCLPEAPADAVPGPPGTRRSQRREGSLSRGGERRRELSFGAQATACSSPATPARVRFHQRFASISPKPGVVFI